MPTPDLSECWRWPGFHRKEDDRPTVSGRYVYRMVYEAATGETLPDEVSLHHTCPTHWCINPLHLEPLSQSEHMTEHEFGGDWGQADKTHCPQEHAYTDENTYVWTDKKTGKKERGCRKCRQAAKNRYRERLRAEGKKVV